MKLTLGFSPCPNDTFIFDALVNGLIDTKGISFEYTLQDVETLNQMAKEVKLDITKLSYGTFLNLTKPYALLYSGSALGKGVGPLLVSKKPIHFHNLEQYSIAIPGINTTANMLLNLAAPKAQNKTELVFHEIENAVLDGSFDVGLVIHESRFTFESKGLHKILDLGDWWENTMNAAIPLGGIVMNRKFNSELIALVDSLLKKSILYSWNRYPKLSEFVKTNAQEMDENVMRQHIQLYVNEFTTNLGKEGIHSIETLFEQANKAGLIKEIERLENIFY